MKKIVRIGKGMNGHVFAKIEFSATRLSITGVEGPKSNGDCRGSCGQIVMHDWRISEYAPGWSQALETRFREVWERWHLNDMRSGSPAQRAFLEAHPVTDRLNYYTKACEALAEAGLNPDPSYLHNGKPYSYGSAWLAEEVPAEVVEFLQSIPESDISPAWV